ARATRKDNGRPVSLFATSEELAKLDGKQVEAVLAVGTKDLQAREIQIAQRELSMKSEMEEMKRRQDELMVKLSEQERRLSMMTSTGPQGRGGQAAPAQYRGPGQPMPQAPQQIEGQTRLTQPGVIEHTPTQVLTRRPQVDGEMIRTITQRSVRQVKTTGEIEEKDYTVSRVSDGTETTVRDGKAEAVEKKRQEVAAKREAEAKRKEEEQTVYIPAGSFFQTVSLTGVDAPTQLAAKASPRPVVLRVKKEAILPNHFQVDIRECHLVAEATGDLSSERAFMRSNVLSCVRNDGRAVEATLHAQAVSEYDGRLGIAGRLVSKNGSALAGALAAGFMSGLSEAVAPQRVGSINTEPGSEALYQTVDFGQMGASATFKGASNALDKLADYYIALADQIHPVIEINPGRKITFMTLQGIALKLR
ncbi:MAG: TraB/VirB10 family protein, partial [Corallincola sp.]|nr:TraB/VirB10 family protein [Corallincola sp.]